LCAAAVHIVWDEIDNFHQCLECQFIGITLCVLLVFSCAFVLPETPGYKDEGSMKMTVAVLIIRFFNTVVVFSGVIGFRSSALPAAT